MFEERFHMPRLADQCVCYTVDYITRIAASVQFLRVTVCSSNSLALSYLCYLRKYHVVSFSTAISIQFCDRTVFLRKL